MADETKAESSNGVSIVLYDRTGQPVTHDNVETITTDTPVDGEKATFTHGVAVSKTVPLDMASGNQIIKPEAGELLSEVTVEKPETLVPENILKGVEIGGVIGANDGITIRRVAERDIGVEIGDDTLESIGSYAFYGTSITSAAFPRCSVINMGIFGNCSNLSSIGLDFENVSIVASGAFSNTMITSVSLPSCMSIHMSAYKNCSNLSKIYAPLCNAIHHDAFCNCSSLSYIYLSTAYSLVSESTFANCKAISTIGECQLAKIYNYAFYGCNKLTSVSIVSGYNLIGASAFYGCFELSKVHGGIFLGNVSPANMKENIGPHAFALCSKLASITIGGKSNIIVGNSVFTGCVALSKVTLTSDTQIFSIYADWFYNTPLSKSSYLGKFGSIYVPSSLYSSFRRASGWSVYSARMVSYRV